jgi:hypothetical protein
MHRHKYRKVYVSCLTILLTVFSAVSLHSQQTPRTAAPSPKFSRDWRRAVQELQRLSWMMNDAGMLQYAESVGLKITSNNVPGSQSYMFDDPVTHEEVFGVSIIED